MVKGGQEQPDVLIPAQSAGPGRPGAWGAGEVLGCLPLMSQVQSVAAQSTPRTDTPPPRGRSPRGGSCPLRGDGRSCRKTSGVPLPGTRLELGGGTGPPGPGT